VTIGDTVLGLLGWPRRSLESGTPGIEGQPKQGPWLLTTGQQQGWLPAEWGYHNFWQMDLDPIAAVGGSAIVEACVAAYAQTIAMCSADHWRALPDGGRERVTNSALSRILRRPNDYQSRSDFMLKLAGDLYRDGNTYALAQRNDRYEVTALHPFDPKQSRPIISDSGDIFYELAGNNVIEPGRRNANDARLFGLPTSGPGIIVPARDVLHVKLEACRAEPLVGVPPSRHAASAIAAQRALGNQLASTFSNMNRPAGIIETDMPPQGGGAHLTEIQRGMARHRQSRRRPADPASRHEVQGRFTDGAGGRRRRFDQAHPRRNLHGLRGAARHPRHDRQKLVRIDRGADAVLAGARSRLRAESCRDGIRPFLRPQELAGRVHGVRR
jgi:hypothetical protein